MYEDHLGEHKSDQYAKSSLKSMKKPITIGGTRQNMFNVYKSRKPNLYKKKLTTIEDI